MARKQHLGYVLTDMFVTDMYPLSLMETKCFRDFVKELDSEYDLPSRTTLEKVLFVDKFNVLNERLHEILSQIEFATISIGTWISKCSDRKYISFHCHFLWEKKLHVVVLATKEASFVTPLRTRQLLEQIIDNWRLEDKIRFTVSINTEDISGAENILRNIPNLPSLTDTLDQLANCYSEIAEINCLVEKCETTLKIYMLSVINEYSVMLSYIIENSPQSTSTLTWRNVYKLIKQILKLWEESQVIYDITRCSLSPRDIEKLKVCVSYFDLISQTLQHISNFQFATHSMTIPILNGIFNKLESIKNNSPEKINIVEKLKASVNFCLKSLEANDISLISTILDPRFKTLGFSKPDIGRAARKKVKHKLSEIRQKKRNCASPERICLNEEMPVLDYLSRKRRKIEPVTIELDDYLNEPTIRSTEDPLQYWEKSKCKFPNIYSIALQYLCIPASISCSEWKRSVSSTLSNGDSDEINSEKVNKFIFLKQNWWIRTDETT
ncbi:zinc finger BED domain-containing protein 1-like [Centruroides sculpturatus]|uniref:zinc finger BED domain-containing protein 1-like n=1 Tax=Centruroides sculpturatus TaxID=218467 RepID=UPI000C6DD080|nr:zinc finger BED domain-containing protein 1-like [Centruroides sculpturatus]XP_023217096.1 zinc finger BED domain-containing protein 1-like [Centruroides sculpturatus]